MIRLEIKLDSLMLGIPATVLVAMPQPLSFQKSRPKCLWCLHPAFSDGALFFERLGLAELADRGWAVICPSLPNCFYLNRHGTAAADFLDQELYPYLEELLPLPKERSMHECLGISMGAFGSLCWAIRNPGYFSRLILVSGYYSSRVPEDPDLRSQRSSYLLARAVRPFIEDSIGRPGETKADADISAMLDAAQSAGTELPPALFLCGADDRMSLEQTRACCAEMSSRGFSATLETVPGEHNPAAWRKCIQKAFKEHA
jgi:enterochelin esterase-like enzyme